MVVYDAGAGEIRTHYAGFFDPGFGFGDGSILGTKVVMEVRALEVPFMVYDGQTSFKVWFERLRGRAARVYGVGLASSYQHQTLSLSKQFRRWRRSGPRLSLLAGRGPSVRMKVWRGEGLRAN